MIFKNPTTDFFFLYSREFEYRPFREIFELSLLLGFCRIHAMLLNWTFTQVIKRDFKGYPLTVLESRNFYITKVQVLCKKLVHPDQMYLYNFWTRF